MRDGSFVLFQLFGKVGHCLRDFDLLGANLLASGTADAGRRLLIRIHCTQRHGSDKAAFAGKGMLVIQAQQMGNIQPLRTVADTVTASGTGNGDAAGHFLGDIVEITGGPLQGIISSGKVLEISDDKNRLSFLLIWQVVKLQSRLSQALSKNYNFLVY